MDLQALRQAPSQLNEEQRILLQQQQLSSSARIIACPTLDEQVRSYLRALRHPITLFGEGPFERRERLKLLLADPAIDKTPLAQLASPSQEASREETTLPVVREGHPSLLPMRRWLVADSLQRSKRRILLERELFAMPVERVRQDRLESCARWSRVQLAGTQVGGDRPLSALCVIDEEWLATGSFGGQLRVWRAGDLGEVRCLEPLDTSTPTRISQIVRLPGTDYLAASYHDGMIRGWGPEQQVFQLSGQAKLNGLAVHPGGRLLASIAADGSWSLWEVSSSSPSSGVCLSTQRGHAEALHATAFHPDGGLLFTGCLGGVGRLWDLRVGRAIWTLPAGDSQAGFVSAAFMPHGMLLTGGEDGLLAGWDLRRLQAAWTIPAHSALVSGLACSSNVIVTGGYDGAIRLWSPFDQRPLANLTEAHAGKCMAVGVSAPGASVFSVGYDRTLKHFTSP